MDKVCQQEIQRAKSQDGKNIRSVENERIVRRDGKNSRDRIYRKQQVRELDHPDHNQQRRREFFPVFNSKKFTFVPIIAYGKDLVNEFCVRAFTEILVVIIVVFRKTGFDPRINKKDTKQGKNDIRPEKFSGGIV